MIVYTILQVVVFSDDGNSVKCQVSSVECYVLRLQGFESFTYTLNTQHLTLFDSLDTQFLHQLIKGRTGNA